MYKITKAINKFADELDYVGGPQARLVEIFARELVEDARERGELLAKAERGVNVTVSKVGPYAEAEFKLPVKDFDKLIAQVKSI